MLDDRQSEPRAALLARAALVDAEEALEYAGNILLGDSDSVVLYLDQHAVEHIHEADPGFSALAPVFDRVAEQVRYDLSDAAAVGRYRNGRLAAYAFFYRHDSRVLLLDYFAVTPELRGRGVGSAFLAALDAVLGGVCILGEVEMPDSHDAGLNAMRLRRIAFYERAGFSLTGAACRLYGVRYAIIARRLPAGLTAAGLRGLLREVYRGLVPAPLRPFVLHLE